MAKIIGYTDVTATELQVLDGIAVVGTVYASKAVTVDANKDVSSLRDVAMRNLDAGASGIAGTVDVFPTTALKGKLQIAVADQTGNTTVTHQIAAMGQATIITTPDPGAGAASHVLTEGVQTVNGAKTFTGNALTTTNVGTVTTGATTAAEEHGDPIEHLTKLTLTAFAMGTSGDNASLALGAKFYTLPAGVIVVENATLTGTINAAISVQTNTPDISIGQIIGTGAQSVMSGVGATAENVLGGIASASVNNGAVSASSVSGPGSLIPLIITAAGIHDLFLNCAAAWVDVAAAGAVTFTGVITLRWRLVS